jgi:hypothetical protein
MFCSAMAREFADRSSHHDHHWPDFFVGPFEWKVFLLVVLLIASAIVGGVGGALCGRLALALARRGVAGRVLKIAMAALCAAFGMLMADPPTVTPDRMGAIVFGGSVGVLVGVLLARKVVATST